MKTVRNKINFLVKLDNCFKRTTYLMHHSTINRDFYNALWKSSRVFDPSHWGHWNIIENLAKGTCLEIGPGNRPKIPTQGNHFLDISFESIKRLRELGGITRESHLSEQLPYENGFFDLICAFEVLEHVPEDKLILAEISRIMKKDGVCLISFPINMKYWTSYDMKVGHIRRYSTKDFDSLLHESKLEIAAFSPLEVPWPKGPTAKILALLHGKLSRVIPFFQDILDSIPQSHLRRKITLKKWEKDSVKELEDKTTVLLMLKKSTSGVENIVIKL